MAVECLKVTPSCDDQVHRLMERIFNHFFPVNSTCCNPEDCRWFLSYANSQKQWLPLAAETELTRELSRNDCSVDLQMSIHTFKLYLSRMLGEQQDGGSPSSLDQDPLALYNSKVRLFHASVLHSVRNRKNHISLSQGCGSL